MKGLLKNLPIIIFLLWAVGKYLSYQEEMDRIAILKRSTKQNLNAKKRLKQKLQDLQSLQQNFSATQGRVSEITSQIEKVKNQLPASFNDRELMGYFGNLAKNLKIKQIRQSQGVEKKENFYGAKIYIIKMKSTYLQLLIFIENLAKSQRIFNIKRFKIHALESSARFQMLETKLEIETYRYLE